MTEKTNAQQPTINTRVYLPEELSLDQLEVMRTDLKTITRAPLSERVQEVYDNCPDDVRRRIRVVKNKGSLHYHICDEIRCHKMRKPKLWTCAAHEMYRSTSIVD